MMRTLAYFVGLVMTTEPMLDSVLRSLDATRGRWPEIAKKSGVPYQTLTKIALGIVEDPRVSTVQSLFDYFAANPTLPATFEGS
jgi:predicted transcriptional regulator